jgi:2-dehydropantoate 2-reductase
MRTLIVGAGAVGGYFGGRLLEQGRDVTFLVRPKRHAQLSETGLVVKSKLGELTLPAPTVLADQITAPYDLVILSPKAYDLDGAMDSMAKAVGPNTAILPLLNGMKHLDVLEQRFGADTVLGGLCAIGATLTAEGHIQHLNKLHKLTFGERNSKTSARIEAITALFQNSLCDWKASPDILQEMWEKWVFLSSLAGLTCLFRASIGDIIEAGGETTAKAILDEAQAIAQAYGHPARPEAMADNIKQLTLVGAPTTASMLRDIEKKSPIEAEHVIGDLVGRGAAKGIATPILSTALLHLRAYEARRVRELEKQ